MKTSCCKYNKNIPFLNFISKRLLIFDVKWGVAHSIY